MPKPKRGKHEKLPKDLRWCFYPGCQFSSASGQKGLEDHAMKQHGALPKPATNKTKVEQPELFDRKPFVRD